MPNYANQYNSSLTSGYTVGDTVLNVGSLPNDFPTVLVAARGTTNETVFQITNGSSGQLTGVSRLRGANINLPQGTAIEGITVPELWNQYATAIFEQAGLKNLLYGADGGSTDDYEITLATTPSSYTALIGVPIVFMANTVNTGASTLNINSLGVKNIKKQGSSALVDLEDGDIQASQLNIVIYDGTQFQLVSSVVNQSVKNYVDALVTTTASSATPTPTGNKKRNELYVTALAVAAELQAPSGTPANGNILVVRIKDDGTARALTYNAIYRGIVADLPDTTTISKTLYMGFFYNSADSKWDLTALAEES